MSAETAPARPLIGLSLVARPGIAIRLLDGGLHEIARGSGRLDTEQPQGLYLVEWSSAGRQSQTMVRLDGSQEREEIHFDPSDKDSSDALDHDTNERIALVDAVNGTLRPSERNSESSIILVVSGESDTLRKAADLNLRLYDREEVAMRADRAAAPDLVLGAGERAHCYRVRPGRYHIGFQSILGERLGQSVPALAGRQTLVFLTVSHTKLIVADGEEFDEEDSVGVDPARTTIITVRGDEEDYRVRERVRLARLMLFDLTNATNSLSDDVVAVLDDPKTDPLLKLYGALVALSVHERSGSITPSEARQDGILSFFDQSWTARLRDWIAKPAQPGLPTDALAACWRLQRSNPHAFDMAEWNTLPSRIEAPPMLECAWRWAIEESIARPSAVRGTAIVAATARSAGGSQPWLCWQLAAAKARFSPVRAKAGDLPSLVTRVAGKVAALVDPHDLNRSFLNGLEGLSPDIQATALRALQLVVPTATKVSTDTITDLAVALGLPSRLLRKRLVKTSEALDSASASTLTSGRDKSLADTPSRPREQAPGLSLRILHKNDLQKGRFGGEPRRGGFAVSAEFEKTNSKNWTRAILRVEGPSRDGEAVQFHLHNSFKPPLETRKFRSGVAKLTVTVWGGFTLGVWIPAHGVELELDLAQLSDAPRIVRER
ncbi:hypothetical protein SAMN02982917_3955 [Azospirillum oryzae]|uniref:Prokaryotic YEATS domain-containing protein n=1 Tax=Azospirillum oryzae TaxID=286727 RepID=A0A1X7GJW4_9PROT|nr:pYEATS domain-containing protein [Azospirillum oryzae]SMF70893.1 hypothetical protein SAMN02982917_3955 [Azospirillum oryzae]